MSHWPEYMKNASDETLQQYITDHKKYTPEAVDAAIDELANRGRPLPPDEILQIRANVNAVQEEQRRRLNGYSENQTDNPDDPALYTSKALHAFAFFFGAIFTAVLFCLNLARVRKTEWILPVLGAAVAITAFQVLVLPEMKGTQLIGGLISLGFASLLQHVLWRKITPADLKYRKRPALYPALIGIGLVIVFILMMTQRF